jgi:hypothetical protein
MSETLYTGIVSDLELEFLSNQYRPAEHFIQAALEKIKDGYWHGHWIAFCDSEANISYFAVIDPSLMLEIGDMADEPGVDELVFNDPRAFRISSGLLAKLVAHFALIPISAGGKVSEDAISSISALISS